MGIPDPILGRVAHAAMIQQMIRVFPDIHVHNDPYPIQLGSGGWITVITRATGTFIGEMIMPDGKVIAPTGKSFDLDFATTVAIDTRSSITRSGDQRKTMRHERAARHSGAHGRQLRRWRPGLILSTTISAP
jgi:hypothetical protein